MRPTRFSVAGLAAVTLLSLAALGGCSDSGGGGSATGEEVFRKNCASCHGTDGGGGLGPDLHGVAERLTRQEHVDVVREGKGQMPQFASNLSDAEIDKVVDYERGLGAPTPPPGGGDGPSSSDGAPPSSDGSSTSAGSVPVPGGG